MFLRSCIQIIKPKIIIGNIISLISGIILASKNKNIEYNNFFCILGTFLIIASSCVFNNFIDRDIDQIMPRTKNRIVIKKKISYCLVIFYGLLLFLCGVIVLYFSVNKLTLILTILAFIIYVFIYSLYMKRFYIHSIIVGGISGALPPIIGYCSITNFLDLCTLILFVIFMIWQIPHSYALEIYYLKDYKQANIPVFPIKKGLNKSRKYIILYILIFSVLSNLLYIYNYVGYIYFININLVNIFWILISLSFKRNEVYSIWAKKNFLFSIFVITNFKLRGPESNESTELLQIPEVKMQP